MSADEPADIIDAAQGALRLARAEGADEAEAYVGSVRGLSIVVVGGLTYVREMRESGIGLRIIAGRRVASASVEGHSADAQRKVVAEAMRRARAKPDAPNLPVFARPQPPLAAAPSLVHPALASLDADAVARDALEISDLLASGRDVTFHETKLLTYDQSFALANTRGLATWDRDAVQVLKTEARVTRGTLSRTASDTVIADEPAREAADVDAMARQVISRATLALDAKPLPKPVDEVILAPTPASQVLKLWLPALAGEHEGPHAHPRAKPVGSEVAARALTVRDHPRAGGGPRRQRVDDEGTPTRDITLVDRGELRARLYGATVAARAGVEPTGHAYRGFTSRWSALPSVQTANVVIDEGSRTLDELISGMDRGVVLTDQLLGAFVANPRTGDFSLVAPTCLYVERGAVQHALPATTIGGDAHAVAQQVLAVGRGAGHTLYGRIPPLHVRGIACAT